MTASIMEYVVEGLCIFVVGVLLWSQGSRIRASERRVRELEAELQKNRD